MYRKISLKQLTNSYIALYQENSSKKCEKRNLYYASYNSSRNCFNVLSNCFMQ